MSIGLELLVEKSGAAETVIGCDTLRIDAEGDPIEPQRSRVHGAMRSHRRWRSRARLSRRRGRAGGKHAAGDDDRGAIYATAGNPARRDGHGAHSAPKWLVYEFKRGRAAGVDPH